MTKYTEDDKLIMEHLGRTRQQIDNYVTGKTEIPKVFREGVDSLLMKGVIKYLPWWVK